MSLNNRHETVMTEKQIQHTIEMYHRKAMREPTKRLHAAIEQASKTQCWYNGWKHEGQLADYGVLYEPMRKFISEAQFSDICAMCEFLMARANAQIEKSNDDGNCADQARYWMEKLLKALMKSEVDIAEKMAWLEDFQKHDDYSLADFARTMLNKRNTLSQEDWSRLADMKIARFKNSPKVEDDGRSDEDIRSWIDDKVAVEEIEAALRNAGRADEITDFRKAILGRFGTAEDVAESLLADGRAQEAEEWYAKSLKQSPPSLTTRVRLREFALARGDLLTAAAYDAESFFDNPTIGAYDQLMAICTVVGLAEAVRAVIFRSLESGIRPDFNETKTEDWPLPIVPISTKQRQKTGRCRLWLYVAFWSKSQSRASGCCLNWHGANISRKRHSRFTSGDSNDARKAAANRLKLNQLVRVLRRVRN